MGLLFTFPWRGHSENRLKGADLNYIWDLFATGFPEPVTSEPVTCTISGVWTFVVMNSSSNELFIQEADVDNENPFPTIVSTRVVKPEEGFASDINVARETSTGILSSENLVLLYGANGIRPPPAYKHEWLRRRVTLFQSKMLRRDRTLEETLEKINQSLSEAVRCGWQVKLRVSQFFIDAQARRIEMVIEDADTIEPCNQQSEIEFQ